MNVGLMKMGLTNGLIVWGFVPQRFENWDCFRFQVKNRAGGGAGGGF
jgi:hypothetical protein